MLSTVLLVCVVCVSAVSAADPFLGAWYSPDAAGAEQVILFEPSNFISYRFGSDGGADMDLGAYTVHGQRLTIIFTYPEVAYLQMEFEMDGEDSFSATDLHTATTYFYTRLQASDFDGVWKGDAESVLGEFDTVFQVSNGLFLWYLTTGDPRDTIATFGYFHPVTDNTTYAMQFAAVFNRTEKLLPAPGDVIGVNVTYDQFDLFTPLKIETPHDEYTVNLHELQLETTLGGVWLGKTTGSNPCMTTFEVTANLFRSYQYNCADGGGSASLGTFVLYGDNGFNATFAAASDNGLIGESLAFSYMRDDDYIEFYISDDFTIKATRVDNAPRDVMVRIVLDEPSSNLGQFKQADNLRAFVAALAKILDMSAEQIFVLDVTKGSIVVDVLVMDDVNEDKTAKKAVDKLSKVKSIGDYKVKKVSSEGDVIVDNSADESNTAATSFGAVTTWVTLVSLAALLTL